MSQAASYAELYTSAEIEALIREVDEEIKKLIKRPAQQSLDGNFVSFAGKASELRAYRSDLAAALILRRRVDAGGSSLQGPRQEV